MKALLITDSNGIKRIVLGSDNSRLLLILKYLKFTYNASNEDINKISLYDEYKWNYIKDEVKINGVFEEIKMIA